MDILSNYGGSIDRFYSDRLCNIDISDNHSIDMLSVSGDGYKGDKTNQRSREFIISVKDGSEASIDYLVNDD